MFFRHLKNVLSREDNSKTKLRCLEDVLRQLVSPPVDYFSGRGTPCIQNLFYAGCFRLFLAQSRLLCIVSFFLQLVPSRFRLFLARCRSFQAVSCSLQLLSSYFLLVIGCFRSILVRYRLFQNVSGRFRSFQVVPRFSKYSLQLVFFSYFKKSDEDS